MRNLFKTLLLYLPGTLALALVPTITAPPLLRRQQTSVPAQFIGYTYQNAKWEVWDCRTGSAFLISGSYGRCAATASESFIPTNCARGSVMVSGTSSSTCTGSKAQTSCVTGIVYNYIGDERPIMNYQCWPQWDGGNYDATRATTMAPTSTSSSSSSSSSASPSPSQIASAGSSTTSSAQVTNSGPSSDPNPQSESQAWIAGPVIGGVVGAGLFGFLGWWLHKRRQRQKQAAYAHAPIEMHAGEKMTYGHNTVPGAAEMDGRRLHELVGSVPPAEMEGSPIKR
ncbi:hypothetical protein B0J11DRAFT_80495 [Dendryphion nanum]|uniref:Uncharacterized protein n=1 Tax=Dendryphion nanum TaxID=256645 RepID=A0A9P9IFM0_9PLEO|nr:hypothetical protein B0J11DRAFT_80495 [Dendryphion nanum]